MKVGFFILMFNFMCECGVRVCEGLCGGKVMGFNEIIGFGDVG